MAYKQYGNVINTLNIKSRNIFNWNTNFTSPGGDHNLNHFSSHQYITRLSKFFAVTGNLNGFLPSVTGFDYDTASLLIRNSGFTPDPTYTYTNNISLQSYLANGGYVSTQSPAPSASSGQLVQFGSSIRLEVLLYTSVPIDTSTVPNAPLFSNITAGDTQLTIQFVTPGDGGSAITRYEYSFDGVSYTSIGLPSNNTFTITGLTNGLSYTVYLRAVNAKGNSAATSASGRPVAPGGGGTVTRPGAPTFTISFITNTGFRINITPPTNTGGGTITTYHYSLDAGNTWLAGLTNVGPIIPNSLVPGTTYQVSIRAVNSAGEGNAANIQSVTTTSIVPDLVGSSLNTAKTIIQANGYVFGDGTVSASNNTYYLDYPGGLVSAQSPVAGATLAGGGTIRLDYTKYLAAPSYGTIPSIIGLTYTDAITRLQQAGYSNIVQNTTSNANQPYGKVYAQDPVSGTAALVDTVVTMTYSNYTGTLAIPTNTTLPSITYDNLYIGAKMNAVPGSWTDSPTSYLYQWTDSNNINLSGGTGASYTADSSTISRTVKLKIAATNAAGTSSYVTASNSVGPMKTLTSPNSVNYYSGGTNRTANSIRVQWTGGDAPFYFVGISKPGSQSYVTTKIVTTTDTTITGLSPKTNYIVSVIGNNNNLYASTTGTSGLLNTTFDTAPSNPLLQTAVKSGSVINWTGTLGSNTADYHVKLYNSDGVTLANGAYDLYGYQDVANTSISGSYDISGIASGTYKLGLYATNPEFASPSGTSYLTISI